jgi:hypothetical protein
VIEPHAGNPRILRGVRDALELTIEIDGVPTNADAAVTVTVTRADGRVVATDAATTHPSGDAGTGVYRYVLAALDVAEVDVLTAAWTATVAAVEHVFTTTHEIVGGFYISVAEIRAEKAPNGGLEDVGRYPDRSLIEARAWFEDLFEDNVNVAQVPRYALERFTGNGGRWIRLREHYAIRRLLSVIVDGDEADLAGLRLEGSGVAWDTGGSFTRNDEVLVSYEHGLDRPDFEVQRAALTAIAGKLRQEKSSIPERALSMTNDAGTFSLSFAGPDRPTGIPPVDSVISARRDALPLVG